MAKISLKSPAEIRIMAEGGKRLGQILSLVLAKVKPEISTLEIDSWIEDGILNVGGIPSFKMVPRYHWASCVGLNEEVVHSIPKENKIIKAGDLLKIDLGMLWEGFNTDLSWTVQVNSKLIPLLAGQNSKFLETGRKALKEAIKVARVGKRVGHISQTIQKVIEGAGCHSVEVLTGHGVGRELHEEPMIPGVLKTNLAQTPQLLPGMTLAIEIIYTQGDGEVILEDDGWTISTRDGKISGLFEKTIAITGGGPLILTPLGSRKESPGKRGSFLC